MTTVPRPIAISLFGKDHWSTFGYVECRCVDHKGVPDKNHMRTDVDRHPGLIGPQIAMLGEQKQKYPTRLRGGIELSNHDDWDCVDDLEAAGLLETHGTGIQPWWKLTKLGRKIAAELRGHKAKGGSFGTFVPSICGASDIETDMRVGLAPDTHCG